MARDLRQRVAFVCDVRVNLPPGASGRKSASLRAPQANDAFASDYRKVLSYNVDHDGGHPCAVAGGVS
jgi:hypothetical protein